VRGLKRKGISTLSRKQADAFLRKLDREQERLYKRLAAILMSNSKEFAQYEAEFSAKMFTKATDVEFRTPSSLAVNEAVISTPLALVGGKVTIEGALLTFSKAKRSEMIRTIKDGITAGQTSSQITRSIGVVATGIQRNHASALVRTVINHVSTTARMATITNNSDVIKGVQYVATLDGKTTATCASLDGKVFPKKEGPRPPLHWGCRSTVIPAVKDKYNITQDVKTHRPSVGAAGVKQVDGRTNYNSWLGKQPAAFQDDVLGRTKGKLFRQGGLTMDKFVDKNHKPLTLKQLKRKQPQAFERAGLDNENNNN